MTATDIVIAYLLFLILLALIICASALSHVLVAKDENPDLVWLHRILRPMPPLIPLVWAVGTVIASAAASTLF